MFKKVLIAALAAVVGLAVVNYTRVGSHMRLRWKKAAEWASRQVKPEHEIARLRMELANLGRQDDQHYDKVARMAVEVDRLRGEVTAQKDSLTKVEKRIRTLRTELATKADFVVYNDQRFSREDAQQQFDRDVDTFRVAEEALKSRESTLKSREKLLGMERAKLSKLQAEREKMAADLQTLETLLAEERQAQAARESTIDDSGYQRVRQDMTSLRERIEVLKKKRQLRGETLGGPIEEAEKVQQERAKRDRWVETRFGKVEGNKETVSQK